MVSYYFADPGMPFAVQDTRVVYPMVVMVQGDYLQTQGMPRIYPGWLFDNPGYLYADLR